MSTEPWMKHSTSENMSSSINSLPAPSQLSVAVQKAFLEGDIGDYIAILYVLGMCSADIMRI